MNEKRIELWRKHAKKRINATEEFLKPKPIFTEEEFREIRQIREEYSSFETKSKDLSAVKDYKRLLERIGRFNETMERMRQRSAFNFLMKTIQTGIVVSLASLTVIFYFLPPTAYIIPIPFAITIGIAFAGYAIVRKYPHIKRLDILIISQIILSIIMIFIAIILNFFLGNI